jgi:hypothetical protein
MGKVKRFHRIPPVATEKEKINGGTPKVFQNGNPDSFFGKWKVFRERMQTSLG